MAAFKPTLQSPVLDLPLTLKYSFTLTLSDFEKNVFTLLNFIDGDIVELLRVLKKIRTAQFMSLFFFRAHLVLFLLKSNLFPVDSKTVTSLSYFLLFFWSLLIVGVLHTVRFNCLPVISYDRQLAEWAYIRQANNLPCYLKNVICFKKKGSWQGNLKNFRIKQHVLFQVWSAE